MKYNMGKNEEEGVGLLKRIGIRPGHSVLDFGCGSGHYTVFAAKIVGHKGTIYALDKKAEKLAALKERIRKEGLSNVRTTTNSGGVATGLTENAMDVVLLFDVIHLVGENDSSKKADRIKLYGEIYRVAKKDGLISVFPKHLKTHMDVSSVDEIVNELLDSGFTLEKKFSAKVIHDDVVEIGTILNFRK